MGNVRPPRPGPSPPGPARPGPARPGPARLDPARPGPALPGPACPGPARRAPAQPGPARPGPTRPVPAWPRLAQLQIPHFVFRAGNSQGARRVQKAATRKAQTIQYVAMYSRLFRRRGKPLDLVLLSVSQLDGMCGMGIGRSRDYKFWDVVVCDRWTPPGNMTHRHYFGAFRLL